MKRFLQSESAAKMEALPWTAEVEDPPRGSNGAVEVEVGRKGGRLDKEVERILESEEVPWFCS